MPGGKGSRRRHRRKRPDSGRKRQIKEWLIANGQDVCHVCGFEFTEQYTATLDHIRELSNGGTNYIKNFKLAHGICNEARSNSPDRLPLIRQQIVRDLYGIVALQWPYDSHIQPVRVVDWERPYFLARYP